MRQVKNVEENLGVSDGKALPAALLQQLRTHRWVRVPTPWSQ
jgi:hypothetical protein